MMSDLSTPRTYAIGEVAEATGMSVHALRYYERMDLLVNPVSRSPGGRRVFTAADVEWLRVCVRLRESGMPLTELQRFAALVRQGPGNEQERLRILDDHRDRVDAQIRALEECRDLIAWKTRVYAAHVAEGSAAGLWDSAVPPRRPNDG